MEAFSQHANLGTVARQSDFTRQAKSMANVQPIDKQLMQTFVPVNSLTEDHLNTLLRDRQIDYLYKGQSVFEIGDKDNTAVYLLHGELLLTDVEGRERRLVAGDRENKYPVSQFQPRIETAVATVDSSVIRFDATALDNMLCWDQTASCIMSDIAAERDFDEDAEWMMTLLNSNLFYKVPPMNIRQILTCFQPEYFSANDVVLRQGELGDCCYLIKEGSVDVLQANSEQGAAARVAILGVGRCFGEDSLINETTRNATIVMRENGVLMKINKSDFYKLLKQPIVKSLSFEQAESMAMQPQQWLDVRTQDEFEQAHRQGAVNLPLNLCKLKSRILDKNSEYIAYCNTGSRAGAVVWLLREEGYQISALRGGLNGLSREQREAFLARI